MNPRISVERAVPAARTIDLVTTTSKDEVLVYDQAVHHIHHLNAPAAKVWYLCDGQRSVDTIAMESGLTPDAVTLALRTLEDAQLLDAPLAPDLRSTQSRRAFMKKAAIAGLSVPAIVSISAPSASAANSGVIIQCTEPSCCLGSCKDGAGNVVNHPVGHGVGTIGTCTQDPKCAP